jgi:chemotaxis protein CheC
VSRLSSLSQIQLSALQEAGTIGSGHAAMALSQLLGRKIMIAVTRVRVTDTQSVGIEMRKQGNPFFGIHLKVLGDARGDILFALKQDSALVLADVLLNQHKGITHELGELEISSLKEASNILASSYLNALSDLMRITLIPSVPSVNREGSEDLLKEAFKATPQKERLMIGIETEFVEASMRVRGLFLFMPDDGGLRRLLDALHVSEM